MMSYWVIDKILFVIFVRRLYWIWELEFVGLRFNFFFIKLGNFFEFFFLVGKFNSYFKGCCWKIK